MPEDKKVGYLMRGGREQPFAGLVRNRFGTVDELLAEASAMERTLEMRVRQYKRTLAALSVYSAGKHAAGDMLRDTACVVVGQELRKLFAAQSHPEQASLADIVREGIQQAFAMSHRQRSSKR